jgi:hypothetical protein
VSRVAQLEVALVAFCALTVALSALALVHLTRQSPEALAHAKVSRGAWIGLLVFGVALPLPGIAFPIAYLTAIRSRLTSR